MGAVLAYILIGFGSIFILNGVILQIGVPFITRMVLPVTLTMMPFHQDFHVWIDIPLPMALVVRLISATHLPPEDGSVGGGNIALELDISKWEEDESSEPLRLTPVVLIQETSEIDQIQRYKAILGQYSWSWRNAVASVLVLVGILGVATGAFWQLRMQLSKPKEITSKAK